MEHTRLHWISNSMLVFGEKPKLKKRITWEKLDKFSPLRGKIVAHKSEYNSYLFYRVFAGPVLLHPLRPLCQGPCLHPEGQDSQRLQPISLHPLLHLQELTFYKRPPTHFSCILNPPQASDTQYTEEKKIYIASGAKYTGTQAAPRVRMLVRTFSVVFQQPKVRASISVVGSSSSSNS